MGPDIFMSGPLRSEGEEERAVSVEVSVRAATERGFNDYIAGEKALERAFGVCRVPGAIRIGRPERPAAYKYFVIIVGACCRGRAAIIGKRANDRKNEAELVRRIIIFYCFHTICNCCGSSGCRTGRTEHIAYRV